MFPSSRDNSRSVAAKNVLSGNNPVIGLIIVGHVIGLTRFKLALRVYLNRNVLHRRYRYVVLAVQKLLAVTLQPVIIISLNRSVE